MDKLFKRVELIRVTGNAGKTITENVIKESSLTININGQHYDNINTFLGKQEKELVTGHLFAQGIINRFSDIESITIIKQTAEVVLKWTGRQRKTAIVESSLKVTKEDVFNCVRAVLKSSIFEETEAVHSAGLFLHGKEPICIAEDIGRHHALDKVIGAALMEGVPLSKCVVASTGRQSAEMITKICRAGIPIVATKAAVTDRGIALAKKYGVTIIGFVREEGSRLNTDMGVKVFKESIMKIYCGAERVRYN
jgi:FdhD protein